MTLFRSRDTPDDGEGRDGRVDGPERPRGAGGRRERASDRSAAHGAVSGVIGEPELWGAARPPGVNTPGRVTADPGPGRFVPGHRDTAPAGVSGGVGAVDRSGEHRFGPDGRHGDGGPDRNRGGGTGEGDGAEAEERARERPTGGWRADRWRADSPSGTRLRAGLVGALIASLTWGVVLTARDVPVIATPGPHHHHPELCSTLDFSPFEEAFGVPAYQPQSMALERDSWDMARCTVYLEHGFDGDEGEAMAEVHRQLMLTVETVLHHRHDPAEGFATRAEFRGLDQMIDDPVYTVEERPGVGDEALLVVDATSRPSGPVWGTMSVREARMELRMSWQYWPSPGSEALPELPELLDEAALAALEALRKPAPAPAPE
ncbi:hypothetical protein [Streptomyces sp. ST2-7A]|uniref:hypothetical protein n=1 Tax=Streptomyces sp. ST2-7A TaxID=2907214 RepID=UPI001F1B3608|nr:hypothetical protein [Streptomyces sp. ST2-7A]MCE7079183.1 hypothetical protein [Streptomyces sp. ST2-7A]